jgi:hypothetical protein
MHDADPIKIPTAIRHFTTPLHFHFVIDHQLHFVIPCTSTARNGWTILFETATIRGLILLIELQCCVCESALQVVGSYPPSPSPSTFIFDFRMITLLSFQMECVVCFEMYSSAERRPKILPCGHTFCLSCVQKMARVIICPLDKKVSHTHYKVLCTFFSTQVTHNPGSA